LGKQFLRTGNIVQWYSACLPCTSQCCIKGRKEKRKGGREGGKKEKNNKTSSASSIRISLGRQTPHIDRKRKAPFRV
jgi:hypothetical protein